MSVFFTVSYFQDQFMIKLPVVRRINILSSVITFRMLLSVFFCRHMITENVTGPLKKCKIIKIVTNDNSSEIQEM